MSTRALRLVFTCAALAAAAAPRPVRAAACVPVNGASKADNWYCDPFQSPPDVEVDGTEPLVPSLKIVPLALP